MAETDRSIDRSYLDNRSVSRLSGRAWKNKFSKVSYVATFTYVRPRIFIFNRVKSSKDGERERETAEERERRDGFGMFKDGGALFTAVSSAGIRGYFGASLPEPRRGGREREKEGSGRRLPHHHQAAVKLCVARTPLEPRRRKRVRPLVHTAVRRSVCCWWLHQLSALVGCNYPGRAATRRRRRRAERERERERESGRGRGRGTSNPGYGPDCSSIRPALSRLLRLLYSSSLSLAPRTTTLFFPSPSPTPSPSPFLRAPSSSPLPVSERNTPFRGS